MLVYDRGGQRMLHNPAWRSLKAEDCLFLLIFEVERLQYFFQVNENQSIEVQYPARCHRPSPGQHHFRGLNLLKDEKLPRFL
jgi:hypothetical protein